MGILESALLGVVEGVTEFLPISSTGHLILASKLLDLADSAFLTSFEIVIQSGAILAVVVLYFNSFFDIAILKRLVVSFIPTGIIGFAAYPYVKSFLLGNEMVVLAALFFGGIALVAFELLYRSGDETIVSTREITYRQAAFIGVFQALAILPGVSRSAATIVGGLLTSGISRTAIVEYSFLLAVPTMIAATGYDLLKSASAFSDADLRSLAIGFVTSFIVALIAIKWLLSFVRSHSFIAFGIYRVAISILFFFFIL